MCGNRTVKLACKGLISHIYLARSLHKQKESYVVAVLRMRALNSHRHIENEFGGNVSYRRFCMGNSS